MNKFYVYEHYKKGTDECFYVGKGKGNRAMKIGRNQHWNRTVDKYGYYVEYVQLDMSEADAFALEMKLILEYGLDNLTNMTLGGAGGDTFTNNPNKETIRLKIGNAHRGMKRSKETRDNISNSQKGKVRSRESVEKMIKTNTGSTRSKESRDNISKSLLGRKRKPFSQEWKDKMSASSKGNIHTIITCPHCNKSGGDNVMKRWHFDNCKIKN